MSTSGPPHSLRPDRLYAQSLRIISAGVRPVHAGRRERLTCHTFFALYLSPDSNLRFALEDGSEHRVSAEHATLLPPWLPFRHRFPTDGCRHCYILFELPHVPPQIAVDACARRPLTLRDPQLTDGLQRFCREAESLPTLHRALLAQQLAAQAMLALLATVTPAARARLLDPHSHGGRIRPALDYIEGHLADPIALPHLASLLACSPDHCSRLFQRVVGQTPVAYIAARRVQRAGLLLADTDLDLDRIASACGFGTRHYFSRVFTRLLGVSPGRFRQGLTGGTTLLGMPVPDMPSGV